MRNSNFHSFSPGEIVVLLTICALFLTILAPVFEQIRASAVLQRDRDAIRQIGQASLLFAIEHQEELPMRGGGQGRYIDFAGTVQTGNISTFNIYSIAGALARYSGLNDASLWVSRMDPSTNPGASQNLGEVLNFDNQQLDIDFRQSALSYAYIAGLNTAMRPTTPIAYTRGLHSNGQWVPSQVSVYGNDGGHIVFLNGEVRFYPHLGLGSEGGELISTNGEPTRNVRQTITSSQSIYSSPAGADTSSPAGTSGTGS